MNIVTSQFTTRKTQNVESVQACIELWSASKIRRKNARYAVVVTHHRTNDMNKRKKSISKWKR